MYQSSDGSTSLARTFGGNARRHLTFANKPCLLVTGEARQEVRNPNIYQHVLIFDNKCGQAIDVKACYVESDRCVTQKIFAYKKVESILGIVAAAPRKVRDVGSRASSEGAWAVAPTLPVPTEKVHRALDRDSAARSSITSRIRPPGRVPSHGPQMKRLSSLSRTRQVRLPVA